jgi:hypothetical protein
MNTGYSGARRRRREKKLQAKELNNLVALKKGLQFLVYLMPAMFVVFFNKPARCTERL